LVKLVIDDSPAFRANVLAGDVVIALDDIPILSPQQLLDLLPQYAGKRTVVTVLRDRVERRIEVQLNANP
jgi:S1-C subfamily serine protease